MFRAVAAIAIVSFGCVPAIANPIFISISAPNAMATQATAINSAGDAAGSFQDKLGSTTASCDMPPAARSKPSMYRTRSTA